MSTWRSFVVVVVVVLLFVVVVVVVVVRTGSYGTGAGACLRRATVK